MTVQKTLDNKTLTMAVSGRLDTSTTPQLDAELKESIEGIEHLIFDFANLDYISSSGLRVLLYANKVMLKQGDMTVCNINSVIREIFEVTGFIDFLNIK